MSDSTGFELFLIHPNDVDAIVASAAEVKAILKTGGTTRNGSFLSDNGQLLKEVGLADTLNFLSGQRSTFKRLHRWKNHVQTDVTNTYEVVAWEQSAEGGRLSEYTILLPSELDDVKNQLDQLWEFCVNNVETHELLSDYAYCETSEQLLGDMKFFESINRCPWGDEGDGSAFYFFALFSIRALIHEAHERGLAAIYLNSSHVAMAKVGTVAALETTSPAPRVDELLIPSPQLAAIVGEERLLQTEIVSRLWAYVKANGLQDSATRRMINADALLLPIFGKAQISMFELPVILRKHVR